MNPAFIMKGVPSIVKYFTTLTVLYLLSNSVLDRMSPFVNNPFDRLQESFMKLIEPKLERNAFKMPEAFMTTPEIIASRGYPVEIHSVVTDDGYVLELHRIPHGKTSARNETVSRRAVFLQHGMMATDQFWFTSSTNNSLAFILADYGYDVWLGNDRGNRYSRKHNRLDPDKDREYWQFSWDEMGRYDVPASVDYVLNVIGQAKLAAYFGYSLGCSTFLIGASQHPRLNDQVDIMVGLGPTVSVAHLNNYFRYMAPFVKLYQAYQEWSGIGEVHTNNGMLHTIARFICETNELGEILGRFWLSQVFGYSDVLPKEDFYRLIGHYPAGGSANTMAHLFQNYNSGESFLYFDHGLDENMKRYGTPHPPEYNLTKVTAPVYLVHADKDPLATPEDVSWLMSRLGNLKGATRVGIPTFNHGDFIWSPRVSELVYYPVIELLIPSC